MHQRTLDDWEMQRYQLEMEYHDLRSRIENLSEEVSCFRPSVSSLLIFLFCNTTIGRT